MHWSTAAPTSIEIGVPFSDPLADGATVQATSQKALEQGDDAGRLHRTRAGVPRRTAARSRSC